MANTESSSIKAAVPKRVSRKRAVVILLCAILVVVAAVLFVLFRLGALAPTGAAAKYNSFSYIDESEVTEYITDYRNMMHLSDASDEDWSTFLATYNMTPERLRVSTIQQIVCDRLIEEKAQQDGITVTEEESQQSVDAMKEGYAFGDESIWQSTLEQAGRTEEQVKATYRLDILKRKVYTKNVPMPKATDEETKEYIAANLANYPTVAKHIYCLRTKGLDEGGSTEKISNLQSVRKSLMASGVTVTSFQDYVSRYCDDDELKQTGGADGWSVDIADKGEGYREAVESMEKGQVSAVFAENDGYAFIWVDSTYEMPSSSMDSNSIDLEAMPDSLKGYFADSAAYEKWTNECNEWLQGLMADANIVYYPMPSSVPYNVDMSLAQTTDSGSK